MDGLDEERTDLIRRGDFRSAIRVQAGRVARDPLNAKLHLQMAWLLAAEKDVRMAAEVAVAAVKLDPTDPKHHRAAAQYLRLAGEAARAEPYLTEADTLERAEQSAFDKAQVAAQSELAEQVSTLVLEMLPSWPHRGVDPDRFDLSASVINSSPLDSVPNWAKLVKPIYDVGRLAEIEHLGSFPIFDPNDVIQKRIVRGMVWEAPVIALLLELSLRCRPEAAIVEIGANVGIHTVPVASHFSGRVIAFEPEVNNFAKLVEHLKLNGIRNVVALQRACSRTLGSGRLERVDSANPGTARLETNTDGPVRVTTLDHERQQFDCPVAVIKIDVEGHEVAVVEGSRSTLMRDRPIVISEVLGEAGPMLTLMNELGFVGRRLFRSDWVFYPE